MSFALTVSNDNCPVCLNPCDDQGSGRALAHGGFHAIHEVCLRALVAANQTSCPLCRAAITHIDGQGVETSASETDQDRHPDIVVTLDPDLLADAREAENNAPDLDADIDMDHIDQATDLLND